MSPRTNRTKDEKLVPGVTSPAGRRLGIENISSGRVPGSTRETPWNPPGSPSAGAQGPTRPDTEILQDLKENNTFGRYLPPVILPEAERKPGAELSDGCPPSDSPPDH